MSLKFLMQFQAYISNLALILLVEYFVHQKQQCNQPQSMIGYVFVKEEMLRQSGVTLVGECGGGVRWGVGEGCEVGSQGTQGLSVSQRTGFFDWTD